MIKKPLPFYPSGSDNENVSSIALIFRCGLLQNEVFLGYKINFFYFSVTAQTFLSHHIFRIFHS